MITSNIKRSLIFKYFTKEDLLEIYRRTLIDVDNNRKAEIIKDYLRSREIPFEPLGNGTNRFGILIDGYAVKIALDKDGMIDTQRETLYSKELQPYVAKMYESLPNGLIGVLEYVEIFTLHMFRENRLKMTEILRDISSRFFIGDVGITEKNYVNWGKRDDDSIVILDYAYIYNVRYNLFTCTCDAESLLQYDNDFVNLICPTCGKKFTFGEVRRRITRKQQLEEIGDIRRLGYNISHAEEEVTINPEFEPRDPKEPTEKEKKKNEVKQKLKRLRKIRKMEKLGLMPDYWDVYDIDEYIDNFDI